MLRKAFATIVAFTLIFALAEHGYTQTTIPAPGFQPSGLAYDGTFLYASELSGFRTIYKLDPTTGAVLGSFLAPSPAGFDGNGNPNDLVADGAGRLFVSDIGNLVYEIDATGTTIFNSFSLPFRGGAIAFDGTNLYIGDFDSSQVRVTDRFGSFIRTFDSGLRPAGMVFDPTTGHLWVISEIDEKVSEITTNGALVRSCDGPRNPGVQGLGGVTRVGAQLYIAEVSDPDPFTAPDIPGTIFIVDPASLTCNPPIVLPVTIEIKPPASPPVPINAGSKGNIPVAILSTESFNVVTSVDQSSLTFGVHGDEPSLRSCSVEDVNGDGLLDLMCHFSTRTAGFSAGDTEGVLKGETISGTPIQGQEAVTIVPR